MYACSLVMKKSLHAAVMKICMAIHNEACLSYDMKSYHIDMGGISLLKRTISLCCHLLLCLVSMNIQCQWMSVGAFFYCMEEFTSMYLLHTHIHVGCHFVRLPYCCHLTHSNKMKQNIAWKVQPLLPFLQHSPLTSWANTIK